MALPTLLIATPGGTTQTLSQVITGTAEGLASGSLVSIFDNGATTPIATATIGDTGLWSADIVLSQGANAITASSTDPTGDVISSNAVDFQLESVLSPPSHGPGLAGSPHATFVFHQTPIAAVITDFSAAGAHHGIIDLPLSSTISSIAAILHHMHEVGNDAVITFDNHHSLTIEGVSARNAQSPSAGFPAASVILLHHDLEACKPMRAFMRTAAHQTQISGETRFCAGSVRQPQTDLPDQRRLFTADAFVPSVQTSTAETPRRRARSAA